MRIILLAILFTVQICSAAELRPTDRIVPLIQDGGGSTTTFTIVNLEATPAHFELLTRSRLLQTWVLPVVGLGAQANDGYVRGALAANGSVTFRTAGAGSNSERGYGLLFSVDGNRLGITTSIQQPGAGAMVVPVVPEREDRLMLPFDNAGGASTTLVWLSETPYTVVAYTALASDGSAILSGYYQFSTQDSTSQEVFAVADRFPELKGKQGNLRLEISYPDAGIYDELYFSAFAIQTPATGASLAVTSMAAATWKASRH